MTRQLETAEKPTLLALVGATATGKTEISARIAQKIPCEIISCDSMQVYKGMPILTQAPVPGPRGPKIHLAAYVDPTEEYSAARFRADAELQIEAILKRKKIPFLVGGTGLYFRSLLDGLFEADGDTRDPEYRQRLVAEQERHGGDYLHRALVRVDPDSASKIHPNDVRRLVRALEVYHLTGRTLSEQKPNRQGLRERFCVRVFFLNPDRGILYERIERRTDRMLKDGLVAEVRRLRRKRLSHTASAALGLKEIGAFLERKSSLEEAVELLKRHTRNYAKRQISWFRHERGLETIIPAPGEGTKQTADRLIEAWGDLRRGRR